MNFNPELCEVFDIKNILGDNIENSTDLVLGVSNDTV